MDKQEFYNKCIDAIQGTCIPIEETIQSCIDYYKPDDDFDADSMPRDFYSQLDNAYFLCAVCGWWCEAGDYASEKMLEEVGEDVCSDCDEYPEDV